MATSEAGRSGQTGQSGHPARSAAEIEADIATIKASMPKTYAAIRREARPERHGNKVFELVRRGLRGEADCFFALEGGRCLGTRFTAQGLAVQAAAAFVAEMFAGLPGPPRLLLMAPTAADQAAGQLWIAEVG